MVSPELRSQVFLKALVVIAALVLGVGLLVVLGVMLAKKHGLWPS